MWIQTGQDNWIWHDLNRDFNHPTDSDLNIFGGESEQVLSSWGLKSQEKHVL